LISGGIDLGEPGRLSAGVWPAFAPRLGSGLRNIRIGNFTPRFNTGNLVNLSGLPVGYGGLPPILKPVPGLPELVTAPTVAPKAPLPPQIDRRDIPLPSGTPVSLMAEIRRPATWFEYWELINSGYDERRVRKPGATPPINAPKPKPTGNKPMDLGSLITDLGGQLIQAKYGQPRPVALQRPVDFDLPDVFGGVGGGVIGGLAGEALDYFMSEDGTIGVKKKCKKRRRRKRLATVSDIADLAALKSILGNGDAFKTWIATHSR